MGSISNQTSTTYLQNSLILSSNYTYVFPIAPFPPTFQLNSEYISRVYNARKIFLY
jgi:hypothetical protein